MRGNMFKKEEYNEADAFGANTKELKKAWANNQEEISLRPIAHELHLALISQPALSPLNTSPDKASRLETIKKVIKENQDLLYLIGLKTDDDIIVKIAQTIDSNFGQPKLIDALEKMLEETCQHSNQTIDFQSLSYRSIIANANRMNENKIQSLHDLLTQCAKQREMISIILGQNIPLEYLYGINPFGVLRVDMYGVDSESYSWTILNQERYSDQLKEIKNLLHHNINHQVALNSFSKICFFDFDPTHQMMQSKNIDDISLPLTKENVQSANHYVVLVTAKTKDVNHILSALDEYTLEKLQKLSDKSLFEALGNIYFAIADACPYMRGSASIAQMMIFTILKSLGKPLIPFNGKLNINPDILVSLTPKEAFIKNFHTLFDEKLFAKLYNIDESSLQNVNPSSQLASSHTFFHQDKTEPEHTKPDIPIKPDPSH